MKDSYHARKWADDSTEEACREAVLDRLSGFAVIGDTVYRTCDEPMLRLFAMPGEGKHVSKVGWWFPDMDIASDPSLGRFIPTRYGKTTENPTFRGYTLLDDEDQEEFCRFRLDREDEALSFLRASEYGDRVAYGRKAVYDRCIDFVEPALLKRPDDMMALIVAARLSFGEDSNAWDDIYKKSGQVITDWVMARDILWQSDEMIDGDGLRFAFEALVAALPEAGFHRLAKTMGLVATRWKACERDRDLSNVMVDHVTEADMAAIAAM